MRVALIIYYVNMTPFNIGIALLISAAFYTKSCIYIIDRTPESETFAKKILLEITLILSNMFKL